MLGEHAKLERDTASSVTGAKSPANNAKGGNATGVAADGAGTALDVIAAVPLAAFGGAEVVTKGAFVTDKVTDVVKIVDKVLDIGKVAEKVVPHNGKHHTLLDKYGYNEGARKTEKETKDPGDRKV